MRNELKAKLQQPKMIEPLLGKAIVRDNSESNKDRLVSDGKASS
jgi:hypothetical protein